MCKPLPLKSFASEPAYAYLAALKAEHVAPYRANALRIADEHAAQVTALEGEAFAAVARSRRPRLVVDNAK